jgi:transcription antitermination factor NusG
MTSEIGTYAPNFRWYAVWIRSRQEKAVATMLEALSVSHFLPLKSEVRQWSDRKQLVQVPLFSGYLFVQIDPIHDNRLKVLKTPGVIGLVGNNTGPLPIPDQQIDSIRKVLSCGAQYTESPTLKAGDRVQVVRGALAGIEGTLLRTPSETRLIISVDMIQRSIVVDVSRQDIESVMIQAA